MCFNASITNIDEMVAELTVRSYLRSGLQRKNYDTRGPYYPLASPEAIQAFCANITVKGNLVEVSDYLEGLEYKEVEKFLEKTVNDMNEAMVKISNSMHPRNPANELVWATKMAPLVVVFFEKP